MQSLPAIIVSCGLPWIPESPRFLIQTGKDKEARKVLAKLHDKDEAEIEFVQIKSQLRVDASLPRSWSSMVTKKSYRKRVVFAVVLAFGTQATGILVINSRWLNLLTPRFEITLADIDDNSQTTAVSSTPVLVTQAPRSCCTRPASTLSALGVASLAYFSSTCCRATN